MLSCITRNTNRFPPQSNPQKPQFSDSCPPPPIPDCFLGHRRKERGSVCSYAGATGSSERNILRPDKLPPHLYAQVPRVPLQCHQATFGTENGAKDTAGARQTLILQDASCDTLSKWLLGRTKTAFFYGSHKARPVCWWRFHLAQLQGAPFIECRTNGVHSLQLCHVCPARLSVKAP